MWPPPIKLRELLLHHGCVWWVSHERKTGREACSGCCNQPGEGCDGCRVSGEGGCVQLCRVMFGLLLLLHWHRLLRQPEGINMSAAPMASRVSFRPLSSCLAYPGFSKQCQRYEQQVNWPCEQDEGQNTGKEEDGPFCPQKGAQKMIWTCQKTQKLCGRGSTDQIRGNLSIRIISESFE